MTDRELLERAAKAAGIRFHDNCEYNPHGGVRTLQGWWNPLADDGDSAQLRRALRIVVQWFPTDVAAINWSDGSGRSWAEPYGDDPAAAERRAIVRAAAMGGKELL